MEVGCKRNDKGHKIWKERIDDDPGGVQVMGIVYWATNKRTLKKIKIMLKIIVFLLFTFY